MERRVGQLRHDVDDVYELVDGTNQTVSTINQIVSALAATQQQHGTWLAEIRQRVDRMEDAQREQDTKLDTILTLLRGDRPSR